MQSVMRHDFSRVPRAEIPRSSFDRSHGYKTTFNAGELIPVFLDEALPGDTFNLDMSAFGRLATPLHPFMDNMFIDSFFFAVPIRLIWDNWQKFNGEQRDPGDSTDFLIPQIQGPSAAVGWRSDSARLGDYFGLPTYVVDLMSSALPFRAYNLIWNEWFRDQNLQDSAATSTSDGPDSWSSYPIRHRGKRHDYFTSCLPWPQKGPAVELPLGTTAPVRGDGTTTFVHGQTTTTDRQMTLQSDTALRASGYTGGTENLLFSATTVGLETDLSAATAATINQLRQSFQIQKLYERDARGGTRYTEIIRSHFGVVSPDARLQRPEYLGGGSTPINVQPVPQTSETTVNSAQGNLAAFGTLNVRNNGFTKSFTEHCILIGLVSVRADLNYQQGLNRMHSRQTRWDFYWPALSHIGEQAVLSKEIYTDGTANDEDVFGYQERFAEYRYKPSVITREFRSNFDVPLDTWHLAQDFATRPVLNDAFIQENPPVDRVLAVTDGPQFIFDAYFKLRCARPMPMYGVPGLIDHF